MAAPAATNTDTNWFTDANQLTPPRVQTPQPIGSIAKAEALIAKFRTGTSKAFANLDRGLVADDLNFQLHVPDAFRQQESPFCGIAAFVRFWASDSPESYFRFAIDLYENGRARLESAGRHSGKLVVPSPELKAAKPHFKMSPANWLVMGSIREALNNDFNYLHYKNIFQIDGGTSLKRIIAEFNAVGYSKVVSGKSLTDASRYYQQNWRVVICIRPWLLVSNEQDARRQKDAKPLAIADTHIVGLDSEIAVINVLGKPVVGSFQVWTWGKKVTLPGWKKMMPLEEVSSLFYYVAGKF